MSEPASGWPAEPLPRWCDAHEGCARETGVLTRSRAHAEGVGVVRHDHLVPSIRPPHSIVLLVGREDHTAPASFGGATCIATLDCIAVATLSPVDGPTAVSVLPTADDRELVTLGEFTIESEGQVSVRDVFHRDHDAMGVEPGPVAVRVLANAAVQPDELVFVVRPGAWG